MLLLEGYDARGKKYDTPAGNLQIRADDRSSQHWITCVDCRLVESKCILLLVDGVFP
jgi:hypothetical protein